MNPAIPIKPCACCGKPTSDIQWRGNAQAGCSEVWCYGCFKEKVSFDKERKKE